MSTSREKFPGQGAIKVRKPFGFRVRLTLLLGTIILTLTLIALYIAQRSSQIADERSLQERFQGRLNYLMGVRETRENEVADRCHLLAKSPRIQAALEENDLEDLYAVAAIELRDVLVDPGVPQAEPTDGHLKAAFFRFVTADGKLLLPPGSGAEGAPWEQQLAVAGSASLGQQFGYVVVPTPTGGSTMEEVVATPILDRFGVPTHELVLGFPLFDPEAKGDGDLKTGIWFDGHLHMPSLHGAEKQGLADAIATFIKTPHADNNFRVQLHDEPYLLFCKILNPGSRFGPSYEVCLYSLTASLAQQETLRWRILGFGLLILIVGLIASHFLSGRMAQPVEQLAQVSEQNIARREEAEAARQMTEQKYQSIFENAVEGIFLIAPDGRYLSANPAMARIFGYESPEQFIAERQSLFAKSKLGERFLARINSEGIVTNFECEAARRDGKSIWISQNARAVRSAAGELLHAEGTLEDITDRKKSEDQLKTVNAELEKAMGDLKSAQNQVIQQERLRALGQMASGIAHDFNNSLMPVMGFSELLLAQPAILEDKEKVTGYLQMIRTAAKDGASIVARLREFYRTNENNEVLAPVDLAQLLRQVVSLTQPKWKGQARASGADIRVVEDIANVPFIAGDESALREVFTNLIFNAVDAMPKGGTLTISVRSQASDVIAGVSDTGGGMSEEVRQRCFEPFFTTKGDHGTGLGLAMVFGIVQRHGGTVDLQSQLGKGTTFLLHFPAQALSVKNLMAESQPLPASPRLRILLVDDEPHVREVICAFLEIDGHDVVGADDGTVGLQQFCEGKFDLVVTDRSMPGLSGEQMALEIKKISPQMPIILLSGFTNPDENGKIPGITIVVSKPIAMPALRKAVRKAMEAA